MKGGAVERKRLKEIYKRKERRRMDIEKTARGVEELEGIYSGKT